mmetsp:Transcript_127194/g.368267  ORF Transcript_127194/g.368267 Transcript_127194/m.368267 type:complete len:269 (+) Transcript_127194:608-1414(+)
MAGRLASRRCPRSGNARGTVVVGRPLWIAASAIGRSGGSAPSATGSGSDGGRSPPTPRTAGGLAGTSRARRCSRAHGSAGSRCIVVGRAGAIGAIARNNAAPAGCGIAAGRSPSPRRGPTAQCPTRWPPKRRRGPPPWMPRSGATTCSTRRRRRWRTTTSPRSPWPSSAALASLSSAWPSCGAPAFGLAAAGSWPAIEASLARALIGGLLKSRYPICRSGRAAVCHWSPASPGTTRRRWTLPSERGQPVQPLRQRQSRSRPSLNRQWP